MNFQTSCRHSTLYSRIIAQWKRDSLSGRPGQPRRKGRRARANACEPRSRRDCRLFVQLLRRLLRRPLLLCSVLYRGCCGSLVGALRLDSWRSCCRAAFACLSCFDGSLAFATADRAELSRVQNERYRAIVNQVYLHVRTEDAGSDLIWLIRRLN
jgi:hypothetical protein